MKYFVTFSQDQGQYAGTHWFATVRSRTAFLAKARMLGYEVMRVGKK